MRAKYLSFITLVILIVTSMMVCSAHAAIDPKTVVGAWLFDEEDGDEVRDSSGNGRNGAPAAGNLERVEGKFGDALEVAPGVGSRVHVEYHDSFDLETFTLMAWVKFNSLGGNQDIALKQTANTDRNYQIQKNASDQARCSFASGGQAGAGSLASAITLVEDEWYHIAATYDMNELKIYLNGQLENTKQLSIEPDTNANAFSIGAHPTGTNTLDGVVDEVALFNVALAEEDIQAIFAEGLEKALSLTAVSSCGKLTTTWGRIRY